MRCSVFGNGGGLPADSFPTSFGSYYQNKDFGLIGSVSGWFVDNNRVTVYCPDAIDLDKLLQQSRFIPPIECARTIAYENVIVRDVFDLARRECSTAIASGVWRREPRRLSRREHCVFVIADAVSHLISLSGSF